MSILFGRNQLPVFISFLVCGVICGVFYDILKIKRRIMLDRFLIIMADDLIFCAFSTVLLLFNAYAFNDGNLKWYEVPFMLVGFGIYRKTLSVLFIKICFWIIDNIKKLLRFLIEPVIKLLSGYFAGFVGLFGKLFLALFMLEKRRKFSCWHFD